MELLDYLLKDGELEHIASLGDDRELFRVPIERLSAREPFKSLRANDPKDDAFKIMQKSVGDRGVFYPPLAFASIVDDRVHIAIVDGHQRYRAAKDRNDATIVVCICTGWKTEADAFRDGVSAQFARFKVDEPDVLSIAATGKLTAAEIVALTGFSESKVRQVMAVAEHPELTKIVKEELVTSSRVATLLKKCDGNREKIALLINTLSIKSAEARREAQRWENKIAADRNAKWDAGAIKKTKPENYFSSEDWARWDKALGQGTLPPSTRLEGDVPVLDLASGSKLRIRIGDDSEWESKFAIFNFADKKHDEVLLESLHEFVEDLPEFCERVRTIYARLSAEESKNRSVAAFPMPTTNPSVTENAESSTSAPVVQSVDTIRVSPDE